MEGITHIYWGWADAEKNRGDFGRIREEVKTFDHRSRVCIICRGILSNSTNGLYEHVQAQKMHFTVVYKNALRKELNKWAFAMTQYA